MFNKFASAFLAGCGAAMVSDPLFLKESFPSVDGVLTAGILISSAVMFGLFAVQDMIDTRMAYNRLAYQRDVSTSSPLKRGSGTMK
jgi:hypothetical protein